MYEKSATGLLIFLMIFGLSTELPLAGKKKKKEKKDETPDLELKLRASPQAGFVPLTIHFTGHIKNLDLEDMRFCHAGSFLMLRRGEDYQILAGEDPACRHEPEDRRVSSIFSHTYVVQRPGSYEFVAMVKTKEGTTLLSNRVPVRVLSSPGGG